MLVVVPILVFPNVGQCSAFKLTNNFLSRFAIVELYFFVRPDYVEPILKFMVKTVVWPIFNFCLQSRACDEHSMNVVKLIKTGTILQAFSKA